MSVSAFDTYSTQWQYNNHQSARIMTTKSIVILMMVAVFTTMLDTCRGGAIPAAQFGAPVAAAFAPVAPFTKVIDPNLNYDPHPQYTYAYDVQDALTGDSKSQQESRNGDVVSGSYSFIEADGTRRVVEYTADPVNGFNAVVHREPVTVVKPLIKAGAPLFHH